MIEESSLRAQDIGPMALLESVLFVASGPVATSRLAKTLETTPAVIENLLNSLQEQYTERGLRLQWSGNAVQMTDGTRKQRGD